MLSCEIFQITRQGLSDLLKKYQATDPISRKSGSDRKTKITEDIYRKVDTRMEDD